MSENIRPLQPIPEPAYLSHFESQGSSIRIEWTKRLENNEDPIVLLLHGNGSLTTAKDDLYRRIGERFTQAGLQAGILHYMDLYGEDHVSLEHFQRGYLRKYAAVLDDAITYLQKETASIRVALFGHSLGAQLALTEGGADSRLAGIVSVSGSVSSALSAKAKFPPTLILHGDQDQAVHFERVAELEAILNEMGTPYEKRIYTGVGHAFDYTTWIDVIERSAEYLSKVFAQNVEVPALILDPGE